MATRLKILAGENEITYEGEPEDVGRRFDALVERILLSSNAAVTVAKEEVAVKAPPPNVGKNASSSRQGPSTALEGWDKLPEPEFSPSQLAKVFGRSGPKVVCKYRAENPADALLLAMYGFHYLGGMGRVTAPALLKSVRESGWEIKRADRPLADRPGLWQSIGERRGKRYGLTAAGAKHCATLVKQRLEKLNSSPVALERFDVLEEDLDD